MTVTTTKSRLTTYDDYRHLPDDGKQHQIIEGQLYMTPAPTTLHQRILLNLFRLIDPFVNKSELGEILIAPVDVVLSMTDVVQPDLVFVAKQRSNIVTKKNIVDAPDLIAEIVSENSEIIDRNKKMALYERHGVKEYWIVDPSAKCVEQYLLNNRRLSLKDTYKDSQKLASVVVNNFTISPSDIF
jgi:Uma2 family endonuclease